MANEVAVVKPRSLVEKFAGKYSIEPSKLLDILKATAFKQKDGAASNEQMAALLVVADQYGLNPFTREIFAFPDKQNGIVPVVGVDGWSRILNDHPQMDGLEFRMPPEGGWVEMPDAQRCPAWIECVIHRKDRKHPTAVREYLDEVYKPLGRYPDGNKHKPGPWQSSTKRMLRHKALIQGARIAMGFSGIYDDDEAARVVGEIDVTPAQPAVTERSASARLAAAVGASETVGVVGQIRASAKGDVIDMDTGEISGTVTTNAQTVPAPTPFDKEPAAEPAKAAPTPLEAGEALRKKIADAPGNDALTAILKEVMALPASALRNKIMQEWNAKVKSFAKPAAAQPAAPEPPADASPAPQAGTTQSAPPAPAEPPAKGKKKPGTDELKNGTIDSMSKAKSQEELDVVADAAQMYAWTGDHLKELNEAYLSLMRKFEEANNQPEGDPQ